MRFLPRPAQPSSLVRLGFGLALLTVLTLALPAAAEEGDDKPAGLPAVEEWIAIVDAGNYGDSWKTAGTLFREQLTEAQWVQQLGSVRAQLGAVSERSQKSANEMSNLPNAPEGKYLIVQYTSAFANHPNATETVTAMQEEDGSWAVVGYYVR